MDTIREIAAATAFFGGIALGAAASIWAANMLADGFALTALIAVGLPTAIAGGIAVLNRA